MPDNNISLEEEVLIAELNRAQLEMNAKALIENPSGRGALIDEGWTPPGGLPPNGGWKHISYAPRDGTAFLAYGRHTHTPDDAQRGVVAGDYWWAIILWDIWRGKRQWVFAKDGKPTWSEPTHWMPLPPPPLLKGDADDQD